MFSPLFEQMRAVFHQGLCSLSVGVFVAMVAGGECFNRGGVGDVATPPLHDHCLAIGRVVIDTPLHDLVTITRHPRAPWRENSLSLIVVLPSDGLALAPFQLPLTSSRTKLSISKKVSLECRTLDVIEHSISALLRTLQTEKSRFYPVEYNLTLKAYFDALFVHRISAFLVSIKRDEEVVCAGALHLLSYLYDMMASYTAGRCPSSAINLSVTKILIKLQNIDIKKNLRAVVLWLMVQSKSACMDDLLELGSPNFKRKFHLSAY
ncbi:hypothetical protein J6590_001163 [Homalodisca vitripennis]|nr:hypothetical protein J6590_001163 [Homalodisca vitripennis]